MGWYVMSGTETIGPVGADLLGEYLKSGKLGAGTFVRDENGGAWMAVEQSPFAALLNVKKKEAAAIVERLKIALGFGVLIWGGYSWYSCSQAISKREAVSAEAAFTSAPIATPSPVEPAPAKSVEPISLKTAAAETRSVLKRCSPPRERALTQSCMAELRRSFSDLNRIDAGIGGIAKDTPGWFDLGIAISLSKDCCNCTEQSVQQCSSAAEHLRRAEASIRR